MGPTGRPSGGPAAFVRINAVFHARIAVFLRITVALVRASAGCHRRVLGRATQGHLWGNDCRARDGDWQGLSVTTPLLVFLVVSSLGTLGLLGWALNDLRRQSPEGRRRALLAGAIAVALVVVGLVLRRLL